MDRARFIRRLRIAWMAFFGVLCVLLVVLWVRSYWQLDWLRVKQRAKSVASLEGRLRFNDVFNINPARPQRVGGLMINYFDGDSISVWSAPRGAVVPVGVGSSIPYWPLVLVTFTLAAVPCLPRRFSLRTLLITTMLVAVLLGLAANYLHLW
jgi:hypothetical protein